MNLPTIERIRANARDRRPHLPALPADEAAVAPHAAATITTPLDALCAIHVALRLTYGVAGPRIWRLSGARVPADWRPDTAHEDLIAHAAREVQP